MVVCFVLMFSTVALAYGMSGRKGDTLKKKTEIQKNVKVKKTVTPKKEKVKKVSKTEVKSEKAAYVCSYNFYNCKDFSTKSRAQTVYSYCLNEKGSDIHDLDRDNDGDACEDLK